VGTIISPNLFLYPYLPLRPLAARLANPENTVSASLASSWKEENMGGRAFEKFRGDAS
jgi:hypothetical protein